jgi:DNA-binding winged helix-turn-helix (wHTH) protein/tetratricopeptide (TPR) repeat protein
MIAAPGVHMPAMSRASLLRFDRFALDTRTRLLHDGDRAAAVQAKVFELLLLLLEHPGRLFTREELGARLWPDVHVADGSLTKAVSRLRALLGDSGVLQTAPGQGYRLVAEVRAEGSAAPFAPGLLGREGAIEAIADLDEGGLVALSGPAGIGRSALAGAAEGEPALRLALEPGTTLCAAAAGALGLPADADPAAIGRALARRGGLVVVADLGQDRAGVELVSDWRAAAPRCRWLVTSPARLPLAGASVALRGLSDEEGAALLAERSGLEGGPELQALARALDGNPLALVLAAARLRTMTARELLERMDRRLELLRDGAHSLQSSLDRAWSALAPDLREVLLQLAAVRTALPLAAAERAVGPQLHEALPVLVDAGWASVQPVDGATRIGLLHNARAWLEQQPADEARRDARQRLVDWLCELGAEHLAQLRTADAPASTGWLLDHADLLEDLASTREGPPLPALARIAAGALGCRGGVRAAVQLLRRALELGEPAAPERVELLIELGNNLRRDAQFAQALEVHAQAAEAADALGELDARARAWTQRALSAHSGSQDAQGFAARAVELSAGAEPERLAHALYAAFLTTPCSDSLDLILLERACEVPLASRSPLRRLLRADLGFSLHEVGRLREAEAVFLEWLAEYPTAPPGQRFAVLASLGMLLHRLGRSDEGEAELDAAIALARAVDMPHSAVMYLAWRVQARLASGGAWTEALAALAAVVAEREPWPEGRAWVGLMSGLVALREGDPFRALARLEPVDGALHRELLPLALTGACAAHAWLGRPEVAAERATRADEAVRSARGALAAELARAWVLWAREDPAAADRFAAFGRSDTPWVAPPCQRLLELQWLTPAAMDLTRPDQG